ncbi:hypothetical protein FACS1894214_3400 [Planctomycetales bacterium]|nr:hypothetical protein FACS1894214_3400 [Planctomycetales bacterium]
MQEQYQRDLMIYRDNVNVVKTARLKGLAEGEAKRSAEVARNLKRMGLKPADIAKATGLSVSDIEKL